MQNRYVGDVGDFGKYGLLKQIGNNGLTIGVNWYLVPDESHNNDGGHIEYLDDQHNLYRICDPDLFVKLKNIIDYEYRCIKTVENGGILSSDTVFYNQPLYYNNEPGKDERREIRENWHKAALRTLSNCNIIFLDPDNGLQVPARALTGRYGTKYVGHSELKDYYQSKKSIILYQHRPRMKKETFIINLTSYFTNDIFKDSIVFDMSYKRGSIRDFIFITQKQHADKLKGICKSFLTPNWQKHFEMIYIKPL